MKYIKKLGLIFAHFFENDPYLYLTAKENHILCPRHDKSPALSVTCISVRTYVRSM